MGRGRVEGVVVGSGRCRISLRDAGVMWGYTGGVVALLLNHRLMSGNPPGSGRGRIFIPDGMAAISAGLSGSDTPGIR